MAVYAKVNFVGDSSSSKYSKSYRGEKKGESTDLRDEAHRRQKNFSGIIISTGSVHWHEKKIFIEYLSS